MGLLIVTHVTTVRFELCSTLRSFFLWWKLHLKHSVLLWLFPAGSLGPQQQHLMYQIRSGAFHRVGACRVGGCCRRSEYTGCSRSHVGWELATLTAGGCVWGSQALVSVGVQRGKKIQKLQLERRASALTTGSAALHFTTRKSTLVLWHRNDRLFLVVVAVVSRTFYASDWLERDENSSSVFLRSGVNDRACVLMLWRPQSDLITLGLYY